MTLIKTVIIFNLVFLVGLTLTGESAEPQSQKLQGSWQQASDADQLKDFSAQEVLGRAWSSYSAQEFVQAKRLFRQAIVKADQETAMEARLGLGYTLIRLNDPQAEAVFESLVDQGYELSETVPALIRIKRDKKAWDQVARLARLLEEPQRSRVQAEVLRAKLNMLPEESKGFIPTAQELLKLEPNDRSLRLQLAWACFKRGRYACAHKQFVRLNSQRPESLEILDGLGWSLFKQGRFVQAANAFEQAFQLQPSRKQAENLLLALDKTGEDERVSEWLQTWRGFDDPEIRKVAARRYQAWRLPVLTDQVRSGPEMCFSGCSRPWLETGLLFSHREAEEGFSGLDQVRIPLSVNVPQELGRIWSLSLTPLKLEAGPTDPAPFAGSYFQHLETDQVEHDLEDELWGLEPGVGLRIEGRPSVEFELGLTPLGGPIDPRPTFSVRAFVPDTWSVRLHQCSVQDSFLSYAGQQDPYSDRKWGRVLKTGLEGSRTLPLPGRAWLSLDLGGHLYWGKNVVENSSVSGTISLGQTRTFAAGDLNVGVFAMAEHYERNTDFVTFGHGGYFSPDLFWMVGPFVRWTSRVCERSWFDVQVGGGYFDYSTDGADFYHEVDQVAADLIRETARDNLTGRYQADGDQGIGVNAAFAGWHRLNEHLAFGGFGRLNTTSKYEEWQVGLSLRFTLSPRQNLCPPLELIGGSSSCQ